jgi:hypothetical protein
MKDILNRKAEPIVVRFKILSSNVLGFMKTIPLPPHPDSHPHNRLTPLNSFTMAGLRCVIN